MAASERWSPEAWQAATDALRFNGSVRGLLALHEAGARQEVIGAVWEYCYDKPVVANEVIRALREDSSEVAQDVVIGIDELFRSRDGDVPK